MKTSDFDYDLPKELIAQLPAQKRDISRMMLLNRTNKTIEHKHFYDFVDYLGENDLLVLNNTKVIPARLFGKKDTGAVIEIFLLKNTEGKIWECLIRPQKRVKNGTIVHFCEDFYCEILEKSDDICRVKLFYNGTIYENLDKYGQIPLPPYIERNMDKNDLKKLDYERYQTVFAQKEGSVAAPTAGLHFTEEILDKIKNKNIKIAKVTLNVGLGTFRPVNCENILEHKMHSEEFEIDEENAKIINEAMTKDKKIVAVGTTTVRTLETTYQKLGKIAPIKAASELFIYPGFKFNVVDKMLTNFHLPKSTLIMLVSAFAGKDFVFDAYKEAVSEKYRFFSYGDCMFIE